MKMPKIAISLFVVTASLVATSAHHALPPEAPAPEASALEAPARPAAYDGATKDILAQLRKDPEFIAKVEAAKIRLAADPDYRARVEARWPRGKPRPN